MGQSNCSNEKCTKIKVSGERKAKNEGKKKQNAPIESKQNWKSKRKQKEAPGIYTTEAAIHCRFMKKKS